MATLQQLAEDDSEGRLQATAISKTSKPRTSKPYASEHLDLIDYRPVEQAAQSL
jgi:hypothetical protein